MRRPLNGSPPITQSFGVNKADYAQFGLEGHHGVDYGVGNGTQVLAPESGTITTSSNGVQDEYTGRTASGETIVLKGSYEHWLMHLQKRLVSAGDRVTEGQLIGYSDNTGYTTGPHLHWGTRPLQPNLNNGYRGFVDPWTVLNSSSPAPSPTPSLQPYQRKVGGSGVYYRKQPTRNAEIIQEFPANDILDFKGFVRAENVNGNNVWFVGRYTSGYSWSGSFLDTSTNGLQDLTPSTSTLEPYQRKVGQNGVYYRKQPSTGGELIAEYPAGDIMNFKGFVKGQAINGNNVWFVGRFSSGFSWSGAFEDSSTHDLPEIDLAPVTPTPPPAPFEKELSCVTRVVQANSTNYEIGNILYPPAGVVLHDFGTDGRDTLGSSLNHFANADTTAPHLTISGDEIIQNVSLKNRAYHAGPQGNDFWGIEIDPDVDTNPKTEASVRRALAELDALTGKPLTRHKHPEFMITSCGDDIDLAKFTPQVAEGDRIKKIEDYLQTKFGDFK